jgi:hyperosmotically inducible protein
MLMTPRRRCATFFVATMLLFALGCAPTSARDGTGETVDDSVVTSQVKAAIFNEPSLKVFHINVETYRNVVQLSGYVSTGANMDKAVHLAGAVKGVSSVRNDMRLR